MQKILHKSITLIFFLLSLVSQDAFGQGLRKISQAELKESNYESIQSALIRNDHTLGYVKFDKRIKHVDLNLQDLFKLDKAFSFDKSAVNLQDVEAIRLQQKFNNIPIIGAQYIIRKNTKGEVAANGYYRKDVGQFSENEASLSEDQALKIALSNIGGAAYMWENPANEAHLKKIQQNDAASYYPQAALVYSSIKYKRDQPIRLAYQFDIYVQSPRAKYLVEVDASTGEILNKYNQLHSSDVEGTGLTLYNGVVDLNINSNAGTFELVDNTRGDGITTFDMQNGTNYEASNVVTSNDDFFDETSTGAGVSAHYGAAATYDYFINNFGLDSFDGLGAAINSYVRYEVGLVNAYWDGFRMTYGDGDGVNTTALTTLDIIGHEIAHAVTQYSADLIYQDESGALNESFSDIFGQAIEFEAAPETASWNLGDEIFVNNIDMIRSFSDPNAQGQPDTYFGEYWYQGTGDNGGVHYNSGVQNFWFYLLVEGGSGTNDIGYSYNVPSIGLEKAQQIAFRNLQLYMTSTSVYQDARIGAELSAADLYGENSPEHLAVIEAWNAVGVPSQDPILSVSTEIDLGLVLVNTTPGFEVIIANPGLSLLEVDSLIFTDTAFSANMGETSFSVDGESFYSLMTDFSATAVGSYDSYLVLVTNAGRDSVNLKATVVTAPEYTVSVDSISQVLLKGNTSAINFQIANNNDYELSYLVQKTGDAQTSFNYIPTGETFQEGKLEVPAYGKSTASSFSAANTQEEYTWTDTDSGVAFSWIEISGDGMPISLSDDSFVSAIDMNMDFPFYGNDFNTLNICSNGWVSFTTAASTIWNRPLPSTGAPANVVALLAADLHPGTGQCYYKYDSTAKKFVVQYNKWMYYGGSGSQLTMQVQFSSDGEIKILYKEILTDPRGTAGIQNQDRTEGLTVAQNSLTQIYSGYAVSIKPAVNFDWLTLEKERVTIPANTTGTISGTINSALLMPGVYNGDLTVSVDELQANSAVVNIEAEVLAGANMSVDTLVNFATIFAGDSILKTVTVKNIGSDTLTINSAGFTSSTNVFSFDLQPQSIPAGDSVLVDLVFSSTVAGIFTDTFNIVSNNAEYNSVDIVINAEAVDPPVMEITPASLEVALMAGDSIQESLTISNINGASELYVNYSIGNYTTPSARSHSVLTDRSVGETADYSAFFREERALLIQSKFGLAESAAVAGEAKLFALDGSSINSFNPASGELLNSITTGLSAGGPEGLAFDGQFLYYNYDFDTKTIFKVNPSTGAVVDQMSYTEDFDALAHSGSYLYASSYQTGLVYKIDFDTKTILGTLNVSGAAGGVSFGGARGTVFIGNNGAVIEYDIVSESIVNTSPSYGFAYGLGYSNALGKLFITTSSSTLMVNPDDWTTENTLSVFGTATAADEAFGASSEGWMTLMNNVDSIQAGNSQALAVSINAENLFGGTYAGELIIKGNDPLNSEVVVPVTLDVTGVPEMSTDRDSLLFTRRLVGDVDTLSFTITNQGTDLLVGSLAVSGNDFILEDSSYEIPAKFSQTFFVYFAPQAAGEKTDILTITSNDDLNSIQELSLSGECLAEPVLEFASLEVNFSGYAGDEQTVSVDITNTNDYDLRLDFDEVFFQNRAAATYEQAELFQTVGKVEQPTFTKVSIKEKQEKALSDTYSWKDTNEGVSFNWVEISGTGTAISLSDDSNVSGINMGMNFPFYEETFSNINICSNGWISFTYQGNDIWSQPLPNSNVPENVIALLAEDLHPGSGQCYYKYDQTNELFIVQYSNWRYYSGSGTPLTMQIQLSRNGSIKLLYQKVDTQAVGTVGIQNGDRTDGLTVVYNEPSRISAGYAVEISQGNGNWFLLEQSSLDIAANESASLVISSNTAGLIAGEYTGAINTFLPEFNRSASTINVTLNLEGASNISVDSDSIEFGKVLANSLISRQLVLRNTGNDVLNADFATDNDMFSVSPTTISIPAFSVDTLTVSFIATSVSDNNAVLSINSNDPDQVVYSIDLFASARNNAQLSVSTTEVVKGLALNETGSASFTISNAANALDLNYAIEILLSENEFASESSSLVMPVGFYSKRTAQGAAKPTLQLGEDFTKGLTPFVNDSTLEVLENFPMGTTGAVYVDGFVYLVGYNSAVVNKYSLETRSIVEQFSIHSSPYGIAYDGQNFWIGGVQTGVVKGYNANFELIGDFDLPSSDIYGLTYGAGTFKVAKSLISNENIVYSLDHAGQILSSTQVQLSGTLYQLSAHGNILYTLAVDDFNGGYELAKTELNSTSNVYEIVDAKNLEIFAECYTLAYASSQFVVGSWDNGFLTSGFGPQWIALASGEGAVEESTSEEVQLNFDSNGLEEGLYNAQLIIRSNDPAHSEVSVDVVLSVGNFPPQMTRPMEDHILPLNLADSIVIDLSTHFEDPDGDAMTYSVEHSGQVVFTTVTDAGTMSMMSSALGSEVLTVAAFDGLVHGRINFLVEVTDGILSVRKLENNLSIYPNPTIDKSFHVKLDDEMNFRVFDIKGMEVGVIVEKTVLGYKVRVPNAQEGMYLVKGLTSSGEIYEGAIIIK